MFDAGKEKLHCQILYYIIIRRDFEVQAFCRTLYVLYVGRFIITVKSNRNAKLVSQH